MKTPKRASATRYLAGKGRKQLDVRRSKHITSDTADSKDVATEVLSASNAIINGIRSKLDRDIDFLQKQLNSIDIVVRTKHIQTELRLSALDPASSIPSHARNRPLRESRIIQLFRDLNPGEKEPNTSEVAASGAIEKKSREQIQNLLHSSRTITPILCSKMRRGPVLIE